LYFSRGDDDDDEANPRGESPFESRFGGLPDEREKRTTTTTIVVRDRRPRVLIIDRW
jgi:hypothetical protein